MRPRFEMCIVNRDLVDDLFPMAGGNAEVMQRLGISWNSWIKIVAGMPIRKSLALRLKERVLVHAGGIEGFKRKFPSASAVDGIDRAALDEAFLRPARDITQADVPALRSLRRAIELAGQNQHA